MTYKHGEKTLNPTTILATAAFVVVESLYEIRPL